MYARQVKRQYALMRHELGREAEAGRSGTGTQHSPREARGMWEIELEFE